MSSTLPSPPVAKRVPKTDVVHGDVRVDDYFWMRDREDPDVTAYLTAENVYTDAVMKPTEGFQESLYAEMLARIKEDDQTVPYRRRGFFYYSRTEKGKQYPIYCRKAGSLEAPEQVMLDLNQLAVGHPFLALGAASVSDDGRLLAYTTDLTGFREYTLYVKDLDTGALLPDRAEKVSAVTWAADEQTLFYVTEDEAKRPYRLHRHRLGATVADLLHEETDALFRLHVGRSRSLAYLFLISGSFTTTAAVDDPGPGRWQELLPHRDDVMLEDVEVFADHYVVHEREDGLIRLRVTDARTGAHHHVQFPEPTYDLDADANAEFETDAYRLRYQSLITPASVFDYDIAGQRLRLLKQAEVLGGYDAARYRSERIHAVAGDGTRVPISLVRRADAVRDGSVPMLLAGYGAYGYPYPAGFSSNRLSLLDRGVSVAIAHVRGGGELGKRWHDEGRMMAKRNTFTDFIAVADHLVKDGYTAVDRLVIEGGSAGGLLMGAVLNLRPDCAAAAVLRVPFVDVINTMLDESLPLTVGEFEEWGNPKIREQYEYMKTYCPYTNLDARRYPAVLVKTSLHDSQVMYWEPAKWVARLRALGGPRVPPVFKINMAAGHGGASGRYDYLREIAFDYAFILTRLAPFLLGPLPSPPSGERAGGGGGRAPPGRTHAAP